MNLISSTQNQTDAQGQVHKTCYAAMPLWTDAYLADTRHLTTSQHGAYVALLMAAWKSPEGVPPSDDALAEFDMTSELAWRHVDWSLHTARADGAKWREIRLIVLARDNDLCAYCGERASHVDHIIPKSKGGTNELSNLTAACGPCNWSKGSKTLDDWRRQ